MKTPADVDRVMALWQQNLRAMYADPSDAEDDAVRASDAVFLAGRTEDDFSCVEMYVYDDEQGSLYVHHDVRLEAFPLALAFLQHGSAGARVAVGTMEPRIDVWDLDVMEPAAPVASLGGDAPTAAVPDAARIRSGQQLALAERLDAPQEVAHSYVARRTLCATAPPSLLSRSRVDIR